MCTFICGLTTGIIGAVLVVTTSVITYAVIPGVIENMIEDEVVLLEDSLQMERFEAIPFPLNLTARFWNISNPDEVLQGGVPELKEVGPYVYRLYQRREVTNIDGDLITYNLVDHYEFDPEYSYPNTEDDTVVIANIAYNAILQQAEMMFPALMGALSLGLNGIFGANNGPIAEVRVGDLLFDGIKMCESPGLVGAIACAQVRELGQNAKNLLVLEDGSLSFSLLANKQDLPSGQYVVKRGLNNSDELGEIVMFENKPNLEYWSGGFEPESPSVCNMLNGTDSGVFSPFVDRDKSVYALNTDICRSVELVYQYDLEYEGIPATRFATNELLLENNEGCFCLNATSGGITREDGCLYEGAMELFTCVGAFLVLSYPHFLFADPIYKNGVIGMNPILEDHRIFVDLEPRTGTVIRGAKRGQFNVFMRPISGISASQNLRNTLVPVFWIEEGMSLPEEFVDEITTKLLRPVNLVNTLLPVAIGLCVAVTAVGIVISVRAKTKKPTITPAPASTLEDNLQVKDA